MIEAAISDIADAGKVLGGAMLAIRTNALAAERQPDAPLDPRRPQTAHGLRGREITRSVARRYLDSVEPELIAMLSDVDRLANLTAVLTRLAAGQPRETVRANLRAVADTIAQMQARADEGVARLAELGRELRHAAAEFAHLVQLLAESTQADANALRELARALDDMDRQIAALIAETGVAFTEANLTIAVAPLLALPMAEDAAPTPLMAAALLAPAFARQRVRLSTILAQKREWLRDETHLPPEVRFARGLASSIGLFDAALAAGMREAQVFAARWREAATHIDNIDRSLGNGVPLPAPVDHAGADGDARRRVRQMIQAVMAPRVMSGADSLAALIARIERDAPPR